MDNKANSAASLPPGHSAHGAPSSSTQHVITVNSQNASSMLFYQTFRRGQPKALGIVLIASGVFEIILGIASVYTGAVLSSSLLSGIDFWGGIIYIIAGSLTLVADSKPNICMIKGSLALNIITAIFSFIAFIMVCVDLAVLDAISTLSGGLDIATHFPTGNIEEIINGGKAVLALLLLTNLLLFSVSIAVSVFGCRAIGHAPNAQVFVIQNSSAMPQPPPYLS